VPLAHYTIRPRLRTLCVAAQICGCLLGPPALDVHFVADDDPHVNPLGVKGLGEIALVGMAPAIANPVFHATGRRVRELPIRIENLLET
jgi:CO/xanthine dehydrogenase Mo-binding subunit